MGTPTGVPASMDIPSVVVHAWMLQGGLRVEPQLRVSVRRPVRDLISRRAQDRLFTSWDANGIQNAAVVTQPVRHGRTVAGCRQAAAPCSSAPGGYSV